MTKTKIIACIYEHFGRTGDMERLAKFAEAIAEIAETEERERCAALCEAHSREPQILRATKIDDNPFLSAAMDCAVLIREST